MKITNKERMHYGLRWIDNLTAIAEVTNEKHHDGHAREYGNILNKIYKIVHTLESPKCRENHPKWTEELDDYIKKNKR